MAPTTCRGFSAARAARNREPADDGEAVGVLIARSLRVRADPHHGTAGYLAVDVSLERTRQLPEFDGARRDPVEVSRRQVAGDAVPDLEPLGALRRGRVDAEQIHAAQDERQHRGLECYTAGEPDAGDVSPEIHVARETGQQFAAHVVDGSG